jgi:hypothetical protein
MTQPNDAMLPHQRCCHHPCRLQIQHHNAMSPPTPGKLPPHHVDHHPMSNTNHVDHYTRHVITHIAAIASIVAHTATSLMLMPTKN